MYLNNKISLHVRIPKAILIVPFIMPILDRHPTFIFLKLRWFKSEKGHSNECPFFNNIQVHITRITVHRL